MHRPVFAVLSVFIAVLYAAPSASAQNVVKKSLAAGGSLVTNAASAGLFLDGMTSLLPMTGLVGEVQAFAFRPAELAALGGIRQRFSARSQSDVYGQILVGVASHRAGCGLCSGIAIDVGLGGDVAIDDHWALRIRADVRGGGAAGDLPLLTIGAGIERVWGRR
jgi:hypothetical protein